MAMIVSIALMRPLVCTVKRVYSIQIVEMAITVLLATTVRMESMALMVIIAATARTTKLEYLVKKAR
jgi:hypothetical protein